MHLLQERRLQRQEAFKLDPLNQKGIYLYILTGKNHIHVKII